MNTLHDTMTKALTGLLPQLVTELLARRAAEEGVALTARQTKAIESRIAAQDFSGFTFRNWKWWEQKNVHIELTTEDITHIERKFERVVELLPDLITSESDLLASNILDSLKTKWKSEARRQEKELRGFRDRLARRWREPLGGLGMMLTIAREFGEAAGLRLQKAHEEEDRHLVAVLVRLHARACQVADEVLTLIAAGFAEGAIARWRTLHEIAITAMHIRARPPRLGEGDGAHWRCVV